MDVVAFGEVLWDIIDGVPHIGGAPFNFAAHAAQCGLSSALVSAVGSDELGTRALDAVKRLGVSTEAIVVHPSLPTGTVNVSLHDGIPTYEIVRPVAWDEIRGPIIKPPRAFYFGTLAQRSPASAGTLERLLDVYAESLVFFDVNLRQDYWSRECVARGIARTNILKVNDDEMRILGLEPRCLFPENPRLEMVIETRGAAGCAVWTRSGGFFTSPAQPSGPVVDTVGAGDSFSAAFLAAVLSGADPAVAAREGNIRAGKVAARAGAVPEGV